MSFFFKAFSLLKFNTILVWVLFAAYILPVIFLLGDFEFRIHDQLDSYNVYTVLVDSGKVFSTGENAKIDNIMNGLPRSCFPSGYNVVIWLIMLFGQSLGFFINYILVHLIAFLGAYLFLRDFVYRNDTYGFNWLIAVFYGILPVNTLAGISLAGIPLMLYAFLNLFQGRNIILSYLIFLLYALYSSMIHAGVFVLVTLGIIFIVKLYKRQANLRAFFGILLLAIMYCGIEFELIKSILFSSSYTSHRRDFVPTVMLNIKGVFGMGIMNVFNGNYASANYPGVLIVLFAVLVMIYARFKKSNAKTILYWLIALLIVGIFISFWDWTALKALYYKTKFFLSFNPRRIHFLLPLGMLVLLAVSAEKMAALNFNLRYFISAVMLLIIANTFYLNKKYNENPESLSFNEFFSKPLLKKVDQYINKPKSDYRIIHIGFEPTISQCYGFYTLDSYQNNYPMEYKLQFRKLIEKELEKNPKAKNYFDVWGNRCFLTVNTSEGSTQTKVINHLDFNTPEFKKMGGEYVFSAATILNADSIGLRFMKSFSDKKSRYILYLYKAV